MTTPRISVGITTRNRPEALLRCLRSLKVIDHLDPEVLVFDDASSQPVEEQLASADLQMLPRVLRDNSGPGLIVGRNRLMRAAAAPAVLLLDDDAALPDAVPVERALAVLAADPGVAAIAFAQSHLDGTRWDDGMQPGLSRTPCVVASFIGFAHMLRRESFTAVGEYRESFVICGEEKDLCLRLIDAGHRIVYLPDALVIHEPDPAGRSRQRFLRYVTRNDCLNALYNEPLSRVVWLVPARLALYFRMRRAWGIEDPWGWAWIVRELVANARSVVRDRRPVSRESVEQWKRLRRSPEPFDEVRQSSRRGAMDAPRIPGPDPRGSSHASTEIQ
jgi:GT2 family glycosyltransferase